MLRTTYLIETASVNPYHNLALEKALFDRVEPGALILYLWQNQRTVVFGRNQNVYRECLLSRLLEEGGYPARRLSGGGAVFHDLGNLNFTFLAQTDCYDVDRQLEIIRRACAALGIPAERTGRNDLTAEGRKFSGNAFYHSGERRYHHGTLMVDVDKDALSRYLTVDPEKLRSKGVASIRARVANLREFCPALTVADMKAALKAALAEVSGTQPVTLDEGAAGDLTDLTAFFSGRDWLYGPVGEFAVSCRRRFPWGDIELRLDAAGGRVQAAAVYSDAMDGEYIRMLQQRLPGTELSAGAIAALAETLAATPEQRQMAADLRELLLETL